MDGSDPRTDWQGIHELDEIITIVNPENGWIQNCNSLHLQLRQNSVLNLKIILITWHPIKRISRSTCKVLSEVKNLTVDGLIELAHDPYLPAFEKVIPGLVQAYQRLGKNDREIAGAIEVLSNWDMRTSKESIAMTLAHFYGMELYRSGGNPRRAWE